MQLVAGEDTELNLGILNDGFDDQNAEDDLEHPIHDFVQADFENLGAQNEVIFNQDEAIGGNFGSSRDFFLNLSLEEFLRWWIITFNVRLMGVNFLLKFLKFKFGLKDLPVDYRTLMRTPTEANIEQIGLGSYIHLGLEKVLLCGRRHFLKLKTNFVDLDFNVDGVSVS